MPNFFVVDATGALKTTTPPGTLPAGHHTTHEPGGGDAIAALSGAVITTGTVAAARLGAHHTTHETGGVDAIAALDGSVITTGAVAAARGGTGVTTGLTVLPGANITGTVPDAAQSANVAMRNAANVFTAAGNVFQSSGGTFFGMRDTTAAADQKVFRVLDQNGTLQIYSVNDAETLITNGGVKLDRAGNWYVTQDVYEKQRSVPMGHWIAFAPVLGAGAGTATLGGNQGLNYTVIGKTILVTFYLNINLSAPTVWWSLTLPSGLTLAPSVYATAAALASPGTTGVLIMSGAAGAVVSVQRDPGATQTWPAGGAWYAGTAVGMLT